MTLTCEVCEQPFTRPGRHGPIPRRCSQRCITKAGRTQRRRDYERDYRRGRRARGLDLTDNVARRGYYRERYRRLNFVGVEIPSLHTGHRWLEMAVQSVSGGRDIDPAFRDYGYNDEVGEAVLALLEGRDMDEAVKNYRLQEFVPRNLTIRAGDWVDDEGEDRWFDDIGAVPSAEDEVVAVETVTYELKARYHRGQNNRTNFSKKGRKRLNQPSRRRMRDAGWERRAARRGQEEIAA